MLDTAPALSPSPAHRAARRRKPQQHDDVQPWTAARCQRLLRQLQCRLTSLRKVIAEAKNPAPTRPSKRSGPHENQPPLKRTRYTYSQRRQSAGRAVSAEPRATTPPRAVRPFGAMKFGQCSPASGRVDFSTPMLRKIREQPRTPDSTGSKVERAVAIPQSLVFDLQALRPSSPDGHYRIYEAIFGWLNGLLRVTENNSPAPHPKSLVGMCLRRIPGVMAHIEAWDRQNSESGNSTMWEKSSATLELYGQLESFGEVGTGWNPLRLVVRSQALLILTNAISEGLFEPAFVRVLAELCLYLKCSEAAARMVSNLDSRLIGPQSSMSTLSENTTTLPLGSIVASLHGKKSPGASFECLSHLLQRKRIPLAWLSSRGFRNVWTSGLEVLTTNRPVPSALEFIRTSLTLLAINDGKEKWSRQSNREQTLISVTAALAATAIMVGPGTSGEGSDERPGRGFRRLMHGLDLCVNETRLQSWAARDNGLFILVLARYLAMIEGGSGDTAAGRQATKECRDLAVTQGHSVHAQYRQALVLTCSIAQYRGRVCGVPCHDMLSRMCDALDVLGFSDWFRAGLRTDGAFVLAQKTKDLRDLAFAERLPAGPATAATAAAATGEARKTTIFSGWRWEEGISEWVVPSPARPTGRGRRGAGARTGESAASAEDIGRGDRRPRRARRRRPEGERGEAPSCPESGSDSEMNAAAQSDRDEDGDGDELGSDAPASVAACVGGMGLATNAKGRRCKGPAKRRRAITSMYSMQGSGSGVVAARAARRLLRGSFARNVGQGVSQVAARDDDWDELV